MSICGVSMENIDLSAEIAGPRDHGCRCSMQSGNLAQSADCAASVLWRDNFKENRENCHDFIVLYCVRNWEGISVVENLVRHNNRSFRANKLVIVSPNYKQENE